MSAHSYSGLYYPFIHFKDERWLKLTAFYWDRMARIVPESYENDMEDSETVRALGDFIEPVRPQSVDSNFHSMFLELVQRHGATIRENFGLHRMREWPRVPDSQVPPTAGGGSGSIPTMTYVFHEKMSPEFQAALIEGGIAKPDAVDPRWIGMHPALANVYSVGLASQLAKDEGRYPVTSVPSDYVAAGPWGMEQIADVLLFPQFDAPRRATDLETASAFVAIEAVAPEDIDSVSVETILKFRQKYPRQRAAFQAHLTEHVSRIGDWVKDIKTRADLEHALRQEHDKHIKPKVDQLREEMRESGIKTVANVLAAQVTVPQFITQAAALFGAPTDPIASAGATIALWAIPVIIDRRKARRQAEVAPEAFLLHLEKHLNAKWTNEFVRTVAVRLRPRRRQGGELHSGPYKGL